MDDEEQKVLTRAEANRLYPREDWMPKRRRYDKWGRPEIFMHPAIMGGHAQPRMLPPPAMPASGVESDH